MKYYFLVDNEGFVLCDVCHSMNEAIATAKSWLKCDCYFPSKWIDIHELNIDSDFVSKRVTVYSNGNVRKR